MSLPYTRLWWNGWKGQAQCSGVARDLHAKPLVDGVQFEQIQFSPELQCFRIRREKWDKEDDMYAPEIAAVWRWLRSFSASVKREIGMEGNE